MERHDHRPNKCKKNLDDYAAAKYHILLVVIISNDRQAEFNLEQKSELSSTDSRSMQKEALHHACTFLKLSIVSCRASCPGPNLEKKACTVEL